MAANCKVQNVCLTLVNSDLKSAFIHNQNTVSLPRQKMATFIKSKDVNVQKYSIKEDK